MRFALINRVWDFVVVGQKHLLLFTKIIHEHKRFGVLLLRGVLGRIYFTDTWLTQDLSTRLLATLGAWSARFNWSDIWELGCFIESYRCSARVTLALNLTGHILNKSVWSLKSLSPGLIPTCRWVQNRIVWESYLLGSLSHPILPEYLQLLLWWNLLFLFILSELHLLRLFVRLAVACSRSHRLVDASATCLIKDLL